MDLRRINSRVRPIVCIGMLAIILSACGTARKQSAASGSAPLNPVSDAGSEQTEPTVELPTPVPTAQPTQRTPTDLAADTGAVQAQPEVQDLPAGPSYNIAELDVIAQINQYRIQNGLWPLAPNDMLRSLAYGQANYVSALAEIPWADLHAGASGEDSMIRAAQAGWPTYSHPQQIAINEIAYAGATLSAAMDWWKNSDLHSRTMLSEDYREVGVGLAQGQGMTFFYVVFGSRPGVLPTLYDPASGVLYLSSERYRWSEGGTWIHDVQQVSVTQGQDQPPAWVGWQLSVTAPENPNAAFTVIYDDGTQTVEVQVNPRADIAWLPSTVGYNPAVADAGSQPTPVPTEPPANIAVTYGDHSMEITVVDTAPVNLVGFDIAGGGQLIESRLWELSGVMVEPLSALPPGRCLQVWRYDLLVDFVLPPDCQFLSVVIYLMPPDLFWISADFELRYNGVVIKTCPAGQGTCTAHIP